MADKKITEMPLLTIPATGDLLTIVDVSETDPTLQNKKITVDDLRGIIANSLWEYDINNRVALVDNSKSIVVGDDSSYTGIYGKVTSVIDIQTGVDTLIVSGSLNGTYDGNYVKQPTQDPYGFDYYMRTTPTVAYISKDRSPAHPYWCISNDLNPHYFQANYISTVLTGEYYNPNNITETCLVETATGGTQFGYVTDGIIKGLGLQVDNGIDIAGGQAVIGWSNNGTDNFLGINITEDTGNQQVIFNLASNLIPRFAIPSNSPGNATQMYRSVLLGGYIIGSENSTNDTNVNNLSLFDPTFIECNTGNTGNVAKPDMGIGGSLQVVDAIRIGEYNASGYSYLDLGAEIIRMNNLSGAWLQINPGQLVLNNGTDGYTQILVDFTQNHTHHEIGDLFRYCILDNTNKSLNEYRYKDNNTGYYWYQNVNYSSGNILEDNFNFNNYWRSLSITDNSLNIEMKQSGALQDNKTIQNYIDNSLIVNQLCKGENALDNPQKHGITEILDATSYGLDIIVNDGLSTNTSDWVGGYKRRITKPTTIKYVDDFYVTDVRREYFGSDYSGTNTKYETSTIYTDYRNNLQFGNITTLPSDINTSYDFYILDGFKITLQDKNTTSGYHYNRDFTNLYINTSGTPTYLDVGLTAAGTFDQYYDTTGAVSVLNRIYYSSPYKYKHNFGFTNGKLQLRQLDSSGNLPDESSNPKQWEFYFKNNSAYVKNITDNIEYDLLSGGGGTTRYEIDISNNSYSGNTNYVLSVSGTVDATNKAIVVRFNKTAMDYIFTQNDSFNIVGYENGTTSISVQIRFGTYLTFPPGSKILIDVI